MRYFFLVLVTFITSPFFSQVQEVVSLAALRDVSEPQKNDMIYVKSHTNIGDGGEGVFLFTSDASYLGGDDDGIIINPSRQNNGKWIQQFSGNINVNFYGIESGKPKNGKSVSETIQTIINYATNNGRYDENRPKNHSKLTKGNTIYFPNGEYIIDQPIVLKSGITILGEDDNTLFTAARSANYGYMFTLDLGRISLQLENFVINGNNDACLKIGGTSINVKRNYV